MERITGNDAKLMMEALASVYKTQEQEVISEETQELEENRNQRGAAARLNREKAAAEEDRLYRAGGGDAKRKETTQMQGASQVRVKRAGMTRDQVIELGRKNLAAKASTSSSTGTPPAAPANNAVASKAAPSSAPTPTSGAERRTPTRAELLAAQQARKNAPKVLSRSEIENRAVKAGVDAGKPAPKPAMSGPGGYTVPSSAKPQANLGAKNPMRTPMTVSTPSGSNTYQPGQRMSTADTATMKAAQQQFRPKPTGSAAGSAAKPAAPAGNRAAELAAIRAKAKADTMSRMGARNRMREELDVFDTIKEYLIGEGATEEEALKQMLNLTDEQRTEILEGSCGSKMKKKGGYKK